jgi:hypothetical protein
MPGAELAQRLPAGLDAVRGLAAETGLRLI